MIFRLAPVSSATILFRVARECFVYCSAQALLFLLDEANIVFDVLQLRLSGRPCAARCSVYWGRTENCHLAWFVCWLECWLVGRPSYRARLPSNTLKPQHDRYLATIAHQSNTSNSCYFIFVWGAVLWPDIIYVGTTSPRDEMLTCSYIYCSAKAPRPWKLVYIIGCKRDLVTHVWLCIKLRNK